MNKKPPVKIKDGTLLVTKDFFDNLVGYEDHSFSTSLTFLLNQVVKVGSESYYYFYDPTIALEYVKQHYLPAVKKAVYDIQSKLDYFQKIKSNLEIFLELNKEE